MPVAELQARMSSREFAEWMAYYRLEPFGAEVDHGMVAQLTALTANINRDPKRQPRGFEPDDFMPHLAEPVTPPTLDGFRAKADEIFMAMGGNR